MRGATVTGAIPRILTWFFGWPARRRTARARVRSAILDTFVDLAFGDKMSGWTSTSVYFRLDYVTRGAITVRPWDLYPAIRALETDGYLESWDADPTPERGWRPRRYYRLTKLGLAAIDQRPS